MTFSKDESTDYDKSGTIITLVAIIFQTICAYFSIYRALRTNNLKLHMIYFYSKFPYLIANIYERIVVHILSCQLENKISTLCNPTNKFIGVLIGFIAWNVFEAYLILIVFCFCKKVRHLFIVFYNTFFIFFPVFFLFFLYFSLFILATQI